MFPFGHWPVEAVIWLFRIRMFRRNQDPSATCAGALYVELPNNVLKVMLGGALNWAQKLVKAVTGTGLFNKPLAVRIAIGRRTGRSPGFGKRARHIHRQPGCWKKGPCSNSCCGRRRYRRWWSLRSAPHWVAGGSRCPAAFCWHRKRGNIPDSFGLTILLRPPYHCKLSSSIGHCFLALWTVKI